MAQRTWFITGVSSGFGRQLTDQLLERGECVVGTVRDTGKVADRGNQNVSRVKTPEWLAPLREREAIRHSALQFEPASARGRS
jgi:NAD(P)-dependent dehydrogenase (short-subunit alcohol dehydrogenase family)